METGVSYFSSRTLRQVRDDLQEMADQSCSYVVHCYTETDLAYYRDTMRDVVAASHGAGLEAWLDPWGVAGIFAGETFTRFQLDHPEAWQLLSDGRRVGAACPNHPETRAFLRGWIDACAAAGGDVLFWDEPHFYVGLWRGDFSGGWACYCEHCLRRFRERFGSEMPRAFTPELLAELCAQGRQKGLRNALCLIPTDLAAHGFPEPEERMRTAMAKRLATTE